MKVGLQCKPDPFSIKDTGFLLQGSVLMETSEKKFFFVKNRKTLWGCLILICIIILIYLLKGNTGFSNVKMVTFEKGAKNENPNPLRRNKVVITSIHMGAGHNDSLGLVLASPYADEKQESQLYKYSIQIKNDFLLTVSEEKLKEWVKERNFDDIKATYRKIVNQYLDEPVPEVYISSFFYE
jgi:flagellar basal body-associated protein FliL